MCFFSLTSTPHVSIRGGGGCRMLVPRLVSRRPHPIPRSGPGQPPAISRRRSSRPSARDRARSGATALMRRENNVPGSRLPPPAPFCLMSAVQCRRRVLTACHDGNGAHVPPAPPGLWCREGRRLHASHWHEGQRGLFISCAKQHKQTESGVARAAPIGLSPPHILTLCGSERVLVVSTEPPDDLSCLTTPGVGRPGDGLLPGGEGDTVTQRGSWWTTRMRRGVGSSGQETTPAASSTTPVRRPGAPRMQKRHQREHRPQRPTQRSDPTQHAKGRAGDWPGPQRKVTQGGMILLTGGGGAGNKQQAACKQQATRSKQQAMSPPV